MIVYFIEPAVSWEDAVYEKSSGTVCIVLNACGLVEVWCRRLLYTVLTTR